MQPKDSVEPVQDSPQIAYVLWFWSTGRQLRQQATQKIHQVRYLYVGAVHRGCRIVASNEPGYRWVDVCFLGGFMRYDLGRQKTVEGRQLREGIAG